MSSGIDTNDLELVELRGDLKVVLARLDAFLTTVADLKDHMDRTSRLATRAIATLNEHREATLQDLRVLERQCVDRDRELEDRHRALEARVRAGEQRPLIGIGLTKTQKAKLFTAGLAIISALATLFGALGAYLSRH